ncbi:MAG: 16S rRNA (guanine(527)-N(7))-methyltransferase RsmG [bacterium]|nr:16S rRNA (guanine(527)-N(7))-methyltransferase RsmG [bacterium]
MTSASKITGVRELVLAAGIDTESSEKLCVYAGLLQRWGERHNLVRFSSAEELVRRHLLDAWAGAICLEGSGLLLDVGSGAGLPGVPLLIARPEWKGVLLEPRQKRWAFLRHVIRELGLKAEVCRDRFEDHEVPQPRYDAITSRALGGYGDLLTWAEGSVRSGGRVILWLTDDVAAHLKPSSNWRVLSSRLPALERGCLVEYKACFT